MIDKRESLKLLRHSNFCRLLLRRTTFWAGILAGMDAHEELADGWIFKGGTCLKKCYFETYRFSEDLDFTLVDESHIDEDFLRPIFEEVAAWVADQSGLLVPADQIDFDIYKNPRGRLSCQGKIGYRGPVSPPQAAGQRSSLI